MPKTLFGTTEKSNFILNMKPETLYKWVTFMLILCIGLPQVGMFFTLGFKVNTSLPAILLYTAGFMAILFFIIAAIKNEFSVKENKIFFAVVAMAVWAFVSYYGVVIASGSEKYSGEQAQELINTALMGELGRNEGLLGLFAYFGIFLLAMAVNNRKNIQILMDVMIGFGIVQGLISVLQHIPGLKFLTVYDNLTTLALNKVMLSSGLTGSPIFYGSYIAVVMAVAFAGAVYSKNLLRARIYGAAALLLWLTGLFTSSIVPMVSGVCILLAMTVIVLVQNKKGGVTFKEGMLKTALARFGVLAAGMAVIFAAVLIFQGIYIRDKAIAFYDAYFNLFIVNGYFPKEERSLYQLGLEKGMAYIKENPLLGVGPDCLAKAENFYPETPSPMDRIYNEFLYTAVTRGIPALAAYIVFIVLVLKNALSKAAAFLSDAENWYIPAFITAIIAYVIQSFVSASAVTTAPLFWLVCGLICAKKPDTAKKSK